MEKVNLIIDVTTSIHKETINVELRHCCFSTLYVLPLCNNHISAQFCNIPGNHILGWGQLGILGFHFHLSSSKYTLADAQKKSTLISEFVASDIILWFHLIFLLQSSLLNIIKHIIDAGNTWRLMGASKMT